MMRRSVIALIIAAALMLPAPASAQGSFEGSADIRQDTSDLSGRTWILLSDLYFTQANGTKWKADKGNKTDGASIPWPVWSIVGSPFTGPYVRAALVHDHYCQANKRVRTWQDTHRMFYDAMVAGGVSEFKAQAMYYIVYLRGPKWAKLGIGSPCGTNCINNVIVGIHNFQPASTDAAQVKDDYAEVERMLDEATKAGRKVSLKELEERADRKGANPFNARGEFVQ